MSTDTSVEAYVKIERRIRELVAANDFGEEYNRLAPEANRLGNHLGSAATQMLLDRIDPSRIRESLSDVSHDIWSHWTRWQFSVCAQNEDGSLTIPASLVERWKRQMETPYADLTEREKDSDREQADKILKIIHEGL